MKTVLEIIREAGGLDKAEYLSIENPPFMRLVIEVLPEPGPDGHRAVSVTHYGELNGDLMRDPEVCVEIVMGGDRLELWPYYFRNDYAGVEQRSRWVDDEGNLVCLPRRTKESYEFMALWDANLRDQGFLEAFRRSSAHNGAAV